MGAGSVDAISLQQMGPEGPIPVAQRWIETILRDGDLRRVWPFTHSGFRRELASAWVNANRAHAELAGRDLAGLELALAQPGPDDPLWDGFEQTTIDEFAAYWSFVDLDSWGWVSEPKPHGPDRELVYLVDMSHPAIQKAEGHHKLAEGAAVPATGMLMELVDPEDPDGVEIIFNGAVANRWRVAGLSRQATSPDPAS